MSNKFQQIAKAAGSMTALALSLGLLGQIPAQASLIGDQVNLEIELNGEAPDFVFIPGGSQAIVEPSSGNFPEGVEFVNVFASSSSFDSDEDDINPLEFLILSFTDPASLFSVEDSSYVTILTGDINVEDSFFQGSLDFFWSYVEFEEIQPFTWEVTLNDLNWVDFPTGKIVDVEGFGEGFLQGV
ncbi:hypothetical protein [Okeania sp. SIO1F9]|uniref:hypothetical protein n=1 Tax=Okeania sp. SIO1F9 TaxID=2607813 RepID=UPI001450217F|nr:hypothetical protein [Okeania sp. SIO1F9]NET78413.1 hypothetical protein [Okeania sp. SIO1F9]